jgi:tetratricopeptide (TPR) repeat protein
LLERQDGKSSGFRLDKQEAYRMMFGVIFFLVCGIIVISIFGWAIGLLILIPAGLICLVVFSIIGGIGNFIDGRIDHHHDREDYREMFLKDNENDSDTYIDARQVHFHQHGQNENTYLDTPVKNVTHGANDIFEQGIECLDHGDFDNAIDCFTEVIRVDPAHELAYTYRGNTYLDLGQFDLAIGDFLKAIKLNPTAFTYSCLGDAYLAKEHYGLAVADYTEAIRLDPNSFLAHSGRGSAYRIMGENELAIKDLRKALSLKPDNVFAREELKKILG